MSNKLEFSKCDELYSGPCNFIYYSITNFTASGNVIKNLVISG